MKHIIGIFILMIGLFIGCTKEDADSIDKAKTSVTPATANLNIEVVGPDETYITILLTGWDDFGSKKYSQVQNGILKGNSSYGKGYLFTELDTSLWYQFNLQDSVPGARLKNDTIYEISKLKAGDNEKEVEALSKTNASSFNDTASITLQFETYDSTSVFYEVRSNSGKFIEDKYTPPTKDSTIIFSVSGLYKDSTYTVRIMCQGIHYDKVQVLQLLDLKPPVVKYIRFR